MSYSSTGYNKNGELLIYLHCKHYNKAKGCKGSGTLSIKDGKVKHFLSYLLLIKIIVLINNRAWLYSS